MSSNLNPTLILWDIDGTLLDTGGVGVQPLSLAISKVTGKNVSFDRNELAGMTDYEIIDSLSRKVGYGTLTEREMELIFELYIAGLDEGLTEKPATSLGGVIETLDFLYRDDRYLLGILSGNCRGGGELKLKSANLAMHFEQENKFFASFEFHTRVSLLKYALTLKNNVNVVVVGDTPNDIKAAMEMGVRVVSVATGNFDEQLLETLNPSKVLGSNWTTNQFVRLIN